MSKSERPFADTLKWALIGFITAMVLLLAYHVAFHQSESEEDIHQDTDGVGAI